MAKDLHEILREQAKERARAEAEAAALASSNATAAERTEAPPHTETSARVTAPARAASNAATRDDATESPFAPLVRPVVVAALLFVFALGFYGGVQYGSQPAISSAREPMRSSAPAATADELRRLAERAEGPTGTTTAPPGARSLELDLADPANLFTIQVVSYDDRPSYAEYAEAARAHLVASGLRAAGPLRVGSSLVVLVEAAPRAAQLDGTLAHVRSMADAAGKKRAFSDAILRNIDDLIDR